MGTEKIVTRYKEMWIWIRDNLDSLKKKYKTISRAKVEYLKKHGIVGCGDCILCEAYPACSGCPLVDCALGGTAYGGVKRYWYGDDPSKEKALKCCGHIIAAHDELLKNPTKTLEYKFGEIYTWIK